MRKIFLSLLFIPSLLFSQWVRQYPPSGIELILSIDFANTNTGVAGGWGGGFFGKAAYTTNSGVNWFLAQVPDSSRSLVKVQLIDNNTGYISGAYNIFKNDDHLRSNIEENSRNRFLSYYERIGMTGEREDYRGLFLKTTNGGKNWFTYGALPSNVYYLMGMKFINVNTGFVTASLEFSAGGKNGVLKTTNGGLNWSTLYIIDTADINSVFTFDGNKLFAAGWKRFNNNPPDGIILSSANGGIAWSINIFPNIGFVYDVNFPNSTTGFAVTYDTSISAVIFKTTNAGLNWIKLPFVNPAGVYYSIEFVSGTGKGIAVGNNGANPNGFTHLMFCRTTNYGNNWTNHFISDTVHLLHCSSIVDANTWFAAGGIENAIIYKTTNGGAPIGIEPISSEVPEQFSLYQNYPNPFNPSTRIKFDTPPLPSPKGREYLVRLAVYDILGREIAVLVNEQLRPGTYEVEFNARANGNSPLPSGVYFYRLSINNEQLATRKMVLVK